MSKKQLKKYIKIGIIVLLVAVLVIIALSLFFTLRKYSSYDVIEVSEDVHSNESYCLYDGGILCYSSNGISYKNTSGKLLWDQGISMSHPVCVTSEDYGLLYDQGSNGVVLFNDDGIVSSYSTSSMIAKAGVSDYGVAALLTEESGNSAVYFYDKGGRQLDIEVKNVLAKNSGYPISMSVSPSGDGLVMSLLFADKADIEARISFLNFNEGKDNTDRVVGFYEYESSIFPEVSYLGDDRVVAIGDGETVFYSLSNPASPRVKEDIKYEEEVKSAGAKNEHAFMVKTSKEGGNDLIIYDNNGNEKLNYNFTYEYTKAEISGDYVIIYGGETTLIATLSGHVRYEGEFDGSTYGMSSIGGNKFIQSGDYGVRTVKLK